MEVVWDQTSITINTLSKNKQGFFISFDYVFSLFSIYFFQ